MNHTTPEQTIVYVAEQIGLGVSVKMSAYSLRTRIYTFIRRRDGMCVGVVRRTADARRWLDGYIAGCKWPVPVDPFKQYGRV